MNTIIHAQKLQDTDSHYGKEEEDTIRIRYGRVIHRLTIKCITGKELTCASANWRG